MPGLGPPGLGGFLHQFKLHQGRQRAIAINPTRASAAEGQAREALQLGQG